MDSRRSKKLSHATSTEPSYMMQHLQSTGVWRNILLPLRKETCTERAFDNIPTCLHHWVMLVRVSHHDPLPSVAAHPRTAGVPSVRKRKFPCRRDNQTDKGQDAQAHKVNVHTETNEGALGGSEVIPRSLTFHFHLRWRTEPVLPHLPCVSGLLPTRLLGFSCVPPPLLPHSACRTEVLLSICCSPARS